MKVAIYTRVSTHYQIDKDSLPFQKEELTNYCKYVLNTENYEVFEDAGYSGKSLDRPAVKDMIRRIKKGEFTHLLVYKIDRISRNLLDFVSLYEQLQSYKVAFISKIESFDTSSAMGEAMLKITLVFAELERKMTAERVTAIMLSRAEKGLWNGARMPYGYDWDDENQTLLINDEESKIVKFMFTTYVEQKSSGQNLAHYLHTNNIKTKRGGEWLSKSVIQILRNPIYKGTYRYNYRESGRGTIKDKSEWIVLDDAFPAIISKDLWQAAQDKIDKNFKGSESNRDRSRKNKYALSGLLTCASCGVKFVGARSKALSDGYCPTHYSCGSYRRRKTCKLNHIHSKNIYSPLYIFLAKYAELKLSCARPAAIKSQLLKELKYLTPDLMELKMDNYAPDDLSDAPYIASRRSKPIITALNDIDKETNKNTRALDRLKELYLFDDEAISKADYIIKKRELETKLQELEKERSEVVDHDDNYDSKAFYDYISQFILTSGLDKTNVVERIRYVGEEVLQAVFRNAFKAVHATDGRVMKIEMKDGAVVTFYYSEI